MPTVGAVKLIPPELTAPPPEFSAKICVPVVLNCPSTNPHGEVPSVRNAVLDHEMVAA